MLGKVKVDSLQKTWKVKLNQKFNVILVEVSHYCLKNNRDIRQVPLLIDIHVQYIIDPRGMCTKTNNLQWLLYD